MISRIVVAEDGRLAYYEVAGLRNDAAPANGAAVPKPTAAEREVAEQAESVLSDMRYKPAIAGGKAVPAIVSSDLDLDFSRMIEVKDHHAQIIVPKR